MPFLERRRPCGCVLSGHTKNLRIKPCRKHRDLTAEAEHRRLMKAAERRLTVAKYRKQPVVVEAVPVTWDNRAEVCAFVGDSIVGPRLPLRHDGPRPARFDIPIKTLAGPVIVEWELGKGIQWWIIKGIQGELYPCRNDIFDATYEKVEE